VDALHRVDLRLAGGEPHDLRDDRGHAHHEPAVAQGPPLADARHRERQRQGQRGADGHRQDPQRRARERRQQSVAQEPQEGRRGEHRDRGEERNQEAPRPEGHL
jgi:hypothetical protein